MAKWIWRGGRPVLNCYYYYDLYSLPLGTCMNDKQGHNRQPCPGEDCPDYVDEDKQFKREAAELFGGKRSRSRKGG